MQSIRLTLVVAALAAALPLLQGCVPAVAVAGATAGVMSATDRRTTGTQADDEGLEWKAAQRIPEQFKAASHVNFTAFNGRLLITGEVPSEEARNAIGEQVAKIEGVKEVVNDLRIGPASSLSTRSNDSYITSKVKARLVDAKELSAHHIKVVTESADTFLMGIVTDKEARVAVVVASRTSGVRKVVNVMEVVSDAEARRLDVLRSDSSSAPAPATAVESR